MRIAPAFFARLNQFIEIGWFSYLKGIRVRLDKLPDRVVQDSQLMTKCRTLEADFDAYAEQLAPSAELEDLNWQLEEFRIATFAQQVGTKEKVSEKRIRAALRNL